jgi:TonB family protein
LGEAMAGVVRTVVGIILSTLALTVAALSEDAPPPKGHPHQCDQWYPRDLQRAGVEGTTTLGFRVTKIGWVEHIRVLQSSGNSVLAKMAVLCAKRWRYLPATQDGSAVAADWKADVVWKIADDTTQTETEAAPAAH